MSDTQECANSVELPFSVEEIPHLFDGTDEGSITSDGKRLIGIEFLSAGGPKRFLIEVGVTVNPKNITLIQECV